MTPPTEGGEDVTIGAFMALVDDYADWIAGHEPPKPEMVELAREKRQAVVNALGFLIAKMLTA